MALLACLVAALSSVTGSDIAAAAQPQTADGGRGVHTDHGPVQGIVKDGYRTFQGIPYAAPPKDALRWHSPVSPQPWSKPRDATKPASACPQRPAEVPNGSENEDCLYLNVTTPTTTKPARPKPVMVWLHGGGYTVGAGDSYRAERLATGGDVVVVTVNSRLGIFGFFGHPGLADSGTFGLQDQQAALRWVQHNVAAFGGDPHNVTLAGESSGGYSVCAQLTSPSAAHLFNKAIIQSGPCVASETRPFAPYALPRATVEKHGLQAATDLHCSSIACLRGKSVKELLAQEQRQEETEPNTGFVAPAFGTPILPRDPAQAIARGDFHRTPVLMGNNRDEGMGTAAFAVAYGGPITKASWPEDLKSFFPDPAKAAQVRQHYPVNDDNGGPVFGTLLGDWNFACPTVDSKRMLAARVPVYSYEFSDPDAPNVLGLPNPPFPIGPAHTTELGYLFDIGGRHQNFTPAQEQLADTMIGYWSRFVHTGDPNGGGPRWDRFRPSDSTPRTLSLAPGSGGIKPVAEAAEHQCEFWSAH